MRLYERLHTKIQVPLHKDVLLQSFMQHCKLKASNGAQSRGSPHSHVFCCML